MFLHSPFNFRKGANVAQTVSIITFDEFKLLVNGENIVKKIGIGSKKAMLLQYLVAKINEAVTINELAGVLCAGIEEIDAVDAVNSAIIALKSDLAPYNLAQCIEHENNKCKLVLSKQVDVDFATMQNEYQNATQENTPSSAKRQSFESIIYLYAGEMFSTLGEAKWLTEKRAFYSKMFLNAVQQYAEELNRDKLYNEVVRITKTAIEKTPLDIDVNIIFMQALLNLNRPTQALTQYENVVNLYNIYFGTELPKQLIAFYEVLLTHEKQASDNIIEICDELKTEEEIDDGALVCDYSIFKYIYRLYMRDLNRLDASVYIALVRIQTPGALVTTIETDKAMGRLCEILKQNLRTGDAISRQSIFTYALLLPHINSESCCKIVLERIKKVFYENSQNARFAVEYKMTKLREMKDANAQD